MKVSRPNPLLFGLFMILVISVAVAITFNVVHTKRLQALATPTPSASIQQIPGSQPPLVPENAALPSPVRHVPTRTALLGTWRIAGDATDSEDITLDASGAYQRTLHEKPEDSGTWTYNSGIITLHATAGPEERYQALDATATTLTLKTLDVEEILIAWTKLQ